MTAFMPTSLWWAFLFISYFLAAIPMGLLVAKLYGEGDLTRKGSGNIGMTNVMRVVGKKAGIITFLLDFFKSFIPLLAYLQLAEFREVMEIYLLGCASILGHTKSVFLKFRGGKGVACLMAVLSIWFAWHFSIAAGIWLITYVITKLSSVSSLVVTLLSPLLTLYFYGLDIPLLTHCLLSFYIIFLHRQNISRLINGEEFLMKKSD